MTLPSPNQNLRASIVVPARDEEALIEACLEALASQRSVSYKEYEVLVVLDDCTDGTEARARSVAKKHPSFRLHFLDGPGRGSGPARRVGMEAACARLLGLGRPDGLVCSTDADTVAAPDWLAAQLQAASRGAVAIGGRIELSDDGSLPENIVRWHTERGRLRRRELLSAPGTAEHWQFSGASLALTASVYSEVGGIQPRSSLEDELLERALRQRGIPIDRLLSVRVTTSARLVGRADRGLAHDLALAAGKESADDEDGGPDL
ncbi:MAG: glycosyltransferase [Rubrobacter sp.]|nr:glycosyltransferase [Rubrobacter sp.]